VRVAVPARCVRGSRHTLCALAADEVKIARSPKLVAARTATTVQTVASRLCAGPVRHRQTNEQPGSASVLIAMRSSISDTNSGRSFADPAG